MIFMGNPDRIAAIRPSEDNLIGHPAPESDAQRAKLEAELRDAMTIGMRGEAPGEVHDSAIMHVIKLGGVKNWDTHQMPYPGAERNSSQPQNPSGQKK